MVSSAKSPFKKLFESEKQEDGCILITYKKKSMWFGPISAFFVAIFGAGSISGIMNLVTLGWLESSDTRYGLVALLAFIIVYYWLAKMFFYRKSIIEIKPGESIKSNNITVPVNDIDNMSIQGLDYHFILVSGHGQDIVFAGPILGESLATSIKNVIERNLNKKQITGSETR